MTLGTKGWIAAVILLAVFLLENQIESHLLQPLVVGRIVRLHPLAIILVLAVGGIVAGIAGAIVAVPAAAAISYAWPLPATADASRQPPGRPAVKARPTVVAIRPHRRRTASRPIANTEPDGVEVLIQRLDPGLPLPEPGPSRRRRRRPVRRRGRGTRPGQRAVVPTGIAIALPDGYAAFVHPRSGLAARHGVTIVNAPGTVDAGYRGEIRVTLLNTDADSPVRFQRGDRIAQLVVQRVERPVFHEVETLPGSARGDGGFGSTGGHAAAGVPAS